MFDARLLRVRDQLVRWGPTASALLMGAALLATVWTTDQGVGDACQTLVRGQADLLHDGIRRELYRLEGPPGDADLGRLLDEYRGDGLLYLATLDPSGRRSARAGAPASPASSPDQLLEAGSGVPRAVGTRVRVAWGLRKLLASGSTPRRSRRPAFLIEFEPQVARDLKGAARRTLGVGGLAGAVFLMTAVGLAQWVSRRQREESALERERRLAALGEMSAVLAHEFRNPLASLKGNCQLLVQAPPGSEKARSRAERILDETLRLERLSDDLLDFVRAGELRREPVPVGELIREVAGAVAPERIELEVAPPDLSWSLDRERLRQVLTNLLENAVQAGGERVEVLARERAGRLELRLRDRGPGIPDDELDRIFEPFYTRRIRGNGLGLAVARRLVELHGGRLTASSAPGGGAEFLATIPEE